ncbi:MAG: hypothetical protein EHM70_03430, partial [Chloroflexota bacterium]
MTNHPPRLPLLAAATALALGLVCGVLVAASRSARASTEAVSVPPVSTGTPGSARDSIEVVRAYFDDPNMVALLAAWIEPWEVHPSEGYLVVAVTPEQRKRLEEAVFRLEPDPGLTQTLHKPPLSIPEQVAGIQGYPCYRTVEETFASAQAIANRYPYLAKWVDVGNSWEKDAPGGSPGYDLLVLRLTNRAVSGPKPRLFLLSAIHAREYATAELSLR